MPPSRVAVACLRMGGRSKELTAPCARGLYLDRMQAHGAPVNRDRDAEPDAALLPPGRWRMRLEVRRHVRELALPRSPVSIGAGEGCDVRLERSGLDARHATLRLEPGRARLEVDPRAAPAMVGGVAVRSATLLRGDAFVLGEARFVLHEALAGSSRAADLNPRTSDGGDGAASPRPTAAALATLEHALRWSLDGGGAAERGEVLAALASSLALDSASCVELPAGARESRILAAWGSVSTIGDEPWRSLARSARPGDVTLVERDGCTVAALGTPGGSLLALAVTPPVRGEAGGLLRLAVRVFAHQHLRERANARSIERPLPPRGLVFAPDVVIGRSAAMQRLYAELHAAVRTTLPVLVLGETGSGKEHVARLVHDSAPSTGGSE